MFDFRNLFGSTPTDLKNGQITQLFCLHATFRFATIEFLDGDIKSNDGLGTQIQNRSMELYKLIGKTYIVDEYDSWGYSGKDDHTTVKVNVPTSNTMDAIFALINDDRNKFDKLVEEGPTPKELESHEKTKQSHQDNRKKHLVELEKIANCDHTFKGISRAGFFQVKGVCTKCGVKEK